tara:strand:+ start:9400 stop:9627 length:228 start_codon:yes stop_codon:yes gene_type:complete
MTFSGKPWLVTCATRISPEHLKELKKVSKSTGSSVSTLIREAVIDYLEENKAIKAQKADSWIFQEYEEPNRGADP